MEPKTITLLAITKNRVSVVARFSRSSFSDFCIINGLERLYSAYKIGSMLSGNKLYGKVRAFGFSKPVPIELITYIIIIRDSCI